MLSGSSTMVLRLLIELFFLFSQWNNQADNKVKLCFLIQANGDAALGKYAAGSVVGAGADATLFVANHAY